MSQQTLVPLYYDGQDRLREPPIGLKSYADIKAERRAGSLQGWYVDNGKTFVVYCSRLVQDDVDNIRSKACVIPWSRVVDKLMQPPDVNYPIPACGDHRLRWIHRFMDSVDRDPADRPSLEAAPFVPTRQNDSGLSADGI